MMPGIFINYRSDDDGGFAAALVYQELVRVFGPSGVFRDCRSLEPGTDFTEELWRRLETSSVMLVLIGSGWLSLSNEDGGRRIDDPKDFVRREILRAFDLGIAVIPVLLNSTTLPQPQALPEPLHPLLDRQFVHLRVRADGVDMANLIAVLKRHVPSVPDASLARPRRVDFQHGGIHVDGALTVQGDAVAGDKYVERGPGGRGPGAVG